MRTLIHGFCHDLPVQTENFAENKNQNHAHIDPRLLHVSPDALKQLLAFS